MTVYIFAQKFKMIDPNNVTNFQRTDSELQEWWLFSCVVAGKTASTQARLLDGFLISLPGRTPFGKVRLAVKRRLLGKALRKSRLGQYNRLEQCFLQSVDLDLRTAPVEAFEAIHGVGPKTARMFLMHSRPGQRFAALDTHILKHLRLHGHAAPRSTPPAGPKYRALEEAFLSLAEAYGMTPEDYDLMVWRLYSKAAGPR